jgi:hypothetical protein
LNRIKHISIVYLPRENYLLRTLPWINLQVDASLWVQGGRMN